MATACIVSCLLTQQVYHLLMYEIHTATDKISAEGFGKPKRFVFQAMLRGLRGRCPSCGQGKLYKGYLKVNDQCPVCDEALHHQRADDAPPYFTIFIAGHLIVPMLMAMELAMKPPIWLHLAIWLPVTVIVCLALLPLVKGAIVGLQWALYMHGFDPAEREESMALQKASTLG